MSTTDVGRHAAGTPDGGPRGVTLQTVLERGIHRAGTEPSSRTLLDELSCARVVGHAAEAIHIAQRGGRPLGNVVPSAIRLLRSGDVVLALDDGVRAPGATALHYAAPERLRASATDRRADVFTLGILLWEVLTREPLFAGANDEAVRHGVLYGAFRPPSELNANVPAELDAICKRALARDPLDRYQSARVMAAEIDAVLSDAGYPETNEKIAAFVAVLEAEPAVLVPVVPAASAPVTAAKAVPAMAAVPLPIIEMLPMPSGAVAANVRDTIVSTEPPVANPPPAAPGGTLPSFVVPRMPATPAMLGDDPNELELPREPTTVGYPPSMRAPAAGSSPRHEAPAAPSEPIASAPIASAAPLPSVLVASAPVPLTHHKVATLQMPPLQPTRRPPTGPPPTGHPQSARRPPTGPPPINASYAPEPGRPAQQTPSSPSAVLRSGDAHRARSEPRAATSDLGGQPGDGVPRDVLAGWAWNTGAVQAIDDGDNYELAHARATRRRLVIAIGSAMLAALALAVTAFVFGEPPRETAPDPLPRTSSVAPVAKPTSEPAPSPPPAPQPAASSPPAAPPPAATAPPPVATAPATTHSTSAIDPHHSAAPAPAPAAVIKPAESPKPATKLEPKKLEPAKLDPKKPIDPAKRTAQSDKLAKPPTRAQPVDPYASTTHKPDPAAAYKVGTQQYARGDTTGALLTFRASATSSPEYAPTWRGLGLVYERLNNKGQARSSFKRYLDLAPKAPDAEQIRQRMKRLTP